MTAHGRVLDRLRDEYRIKRTGLVSGTVLGKAASDDAVEYAKGKKLTLIVRAAGNETAWYEWQKTAPKQKQRTTRAFAPLTVSS
jgi:hypothetical protein